MTFDKEGRDISAHWELIPFDDDTTVFHCEKTKFMLKSAKTGKILHRGTAEKERIDKVDGARSQTFDVDMLSLDKVNEDDVFVFRQMADDWLERFQDLQQEFAMLSVFKDEMQEGIAQGKESNWWEPAQEKGKEWWDKEKKDEKKKRMATIKEIKEKFVDPDPDSERAPDPSTGDVYSGEALETLERLLAKITPLSQDQDYLTRDGIPDRQIQDMLCEMRAVRFVLDLMTNNLFKLVPRVHIQKGRDTREIGPYFLRVVRYCFRLLSMMAKHHRSNSEEVYLWLDMIVDQLGYQFEVSSTLTEIFRGEISLITDCDEGFLRKVWDKAMESRAPRYLEFICVMVSDNGRPVKRNQDILIKIISEPENMKRLQWRQGWEDETIARWEDSDHATREEQNDQGIREETFNGSHAEFKKLQHFQFHLGFCRAAALLCAGRHRASIDFFSDEANEFRFTYDYVIKRIEDPNLGVDTRCTFTQLMWSLYVDREPREQFEPNQKSRIAPSINISSLGLEQSNVVDPYEKNEGRRPQDPGFKRLKGILRGVIESTKHIDTSDVPSVYFLVTVVELVKNLLQFGLYDRSSQPDAVCEPLLVLDKECKAIAIAVLRLLDGRPPDIEVNGKGEAVVNENGEAVVKPGTDKTLEILKFSVTEGSQGKTIKESRGRRKSDRFEMNYGNVTLMQMKQEILQVIDILFGMRAASRVTLLLGVAFDEALKDSETVNPLAMRTEDSVLKAQTESFQLNEKATVKKAREGVLNIRVFEEQMHEDRLSNMLIDALQYNKDGVLCFAAFNTLMGLIAQDFYFAKSLSDVSLLATETQAKVFFTLKDLVSEFRRLRKWLHEDESCKQCIDVAEKLAHNCWADVDGQQVTDSPRQHLLANLGLVEYVVRVLQMRLENEQFPRLLIACLRLMAAFCDTNPKNQEVVAPDIDGIFLPLMFYAPDDEKPFARPYVTDSATCLIAIVSENVSLCVRYSALLTQKVAQLAKEGLKSEQLIRLLETLLIAGGHTIVQAQVAVCKGAVVSKELIETNGALDANEWSDGPALSRLEALQKGIKGGDKRCQKHLAYYAKCLTVLGICARGKMPTTELLCASVIPFSESINRLHEIFCAPELTGVGLEDTNMLEIRFSTLQYFREVFVDTNSEHIIRSLKRPKNGVWTIDPRIHQEGVEPLGKSLLAELDKLRGLDAKDLAAREYLFEQVLRFFMQFARVVSLDDLSTEDADECAEGIAKVATLCKGIKGTTERESELLEKFQTVATMFAQKSSAMEMPLLADTKVPSREQPTAGSLRWSAFTAVYQSLAPVFKLKGTDRNVGVGIMRVARELWKVNQYDKTARYCSYLVPPLRKLFDKMVATHPSQDDLAQVLTIVDTIRAIPYSVIVYSNSDEDLMQAFRRFYNIENLNAKTNPDLMVAQTALLQQGWGLLAWRFLSVPKLAKTHLAMLRLLMALTGGCAVDAQDVLYNQMSDLRQCPKELLALSCRRLLRGAIDDLKSQRKAQARQELLKQQREGGRSFETEARNEGAAKPKKKATKSLLKAGALAVAIASVIRVDDDQENTQQGYALETLSVLDNICGFPTHRGFQDYMANQNTHEDTTDLIADIVQYVNHIERDLKSIVQESNEDGGSQHLFEARSRKTLDRAKAAFGLLRSLTTGPNVENQLAIVQTDIVSVVNRILAVSTYTVVSEEHDSSKMTLRQNGRKDVWVDLGEQDRSLSPARHINEMVTTFLLGLLEGAQKKKVVRRLLSALEWKHIEAHLESLKHILVKMDEDVAEVKAQTATALQLEIERTRTRLKVFGDDYSADKQSTAAATAEVEARFKTLHQQVQTEAFNFIVVVQKVSAFQFPPEDAQKIRQPIAKLMANQSMLNFFFERLGQVEVVTSRGGLEEHCFLMPPERLHIPTNIALNAYVNKALNSMDSSCRANGAVKLSMFLEAVKEEVLTTKNRPIEGSWTDPAWALPQFWMSTETFDPKLYLSVLMTFMCVFALDQNASLLTSDEATFARLPGVHPWFVLCGALHVITSFLSFYAFMVVRIPVIRAMYMRSAKLETLKERAGAGATRKKALEEFKQNTVYLTGFRNDIGPVEMKPFLRTYGVVAALYIPSNSSWALVTFVNERGAESCAEKFCATGKVLCELDDSGLPHGKLEAKRIDNQENARFNVSTKHGKRISDDMILDIESQNFSKLYQTVTFLQRGIDSVKLGQLLPVQSLYVLRYNREVWENSLDLVFSVWGCVNPIAFSFHVNKVRKIPAAKIVIESITCNWERLLTTVVLATFIIYLFALIGLFYFFDAHTDANVGNKGWVAGNSTAVEGQQPGGPCGNLLSCTISYSFAGFVGQGLTYWLEPVTFPENMGNLAENSAGRVLFEVSFMIVTSSFVISIITGIISDTFGELRTEQDEAIKYRSTNCFVTGIPYSRISEEKSTSYMQYFFLILYLERKTLEQCSPLERVIKRHIDRGQTDWLPDGRCMTIERQENENLNVRCLPMFAQRLLVVSLLLTALFVLSTGAASTRGNRADEWADECTDERAQGVHREELRCSHSGCCKWKYEH